MEEGEGLGTRLISVYRPTRHLFALLRCTQLPRDGHTSFTRNDQFAVTPTFRRRPRNAGNSDQTFPFPGTARRLSQNEFFRKFPLTRRRICSAATILLSWQRFCNGSIHFQADDCLSSDKAFSRKRIRQ